MAAGVGPDATRVVSCHARRNRSPASCRKPRTDLESGLWHAGTMREAVLLVGGRGTRLRPLTERTPKPMLPVAGIPVTEHQILRAKEAGVTRIILSTSYRAEVFADHFGDGSSLGVELVYATEPSPLGTGGAIRFVDDLLESGPNDPVLIFNGDVLTGLDIAGLVARWSEADADVALYLTRVDDPRAFGLVPTAEDGTVIAFTEKPQTPDEIVTDQINAGCYVFARRVISEIPAGRVVSVERETFPALLERQATVIGVVDDGYWLDLGTPEAFVQGSADLVRGIAPTPALPQPPGESLVYPGASVAADAILDGGTCVSARAVIGAGALVRGSVVDVDARIEPTAHVVRSVVGRGARIGHGVVVEDSVVGDGAIIESGNELRRGARVFCDAHLGPTAVRFSSDQT